MYEEIYHSSMCIVEEYDMESMWYQVDTEKFTKTTMLSADPVVYQKDKYVRVLYYRKSCAVVN